MIVVVCSVIVRRGDHFLFVEEKKAEARGKYGLPGGRLEDNESLTECAHRELIEETGFNISELKPVRVVNKPHTRFGNNVVKFIYQASVTSVSLSREAELDTHWFTLAHVRELALVGKIRGDEIVELLEYHHINPLTITTF